MRTVASSKARAELADLMDAVSNDRLPVELSRPDKPSVLIVDKSEYEGMEATLHLLSTRANAEQLLEAIEQLNAGKVEFHALIDP